MNVFFFQKFNISRLPEAFAAVVPFKEREESAHIMLPHEMFACLFHKYADKWAHTILGSGPEHIWNAVDDHPQMRNHPLKSRAGYREKSNTDRLAW